MKIIYVWLWSLVIITTAKAQEVFWVKRIYGNTSGEVVNAYPTPNGYINIVHFQSAAQLYDNPVVFKPDSATNFLRYSLVGFIDTAGVLMGSQFVVNTSLDKIIPLNDSEFICMRPTDFTLTVNGEPKLDSMGYGSWGYGHRLMKFHRSGEVTLLHDFPILLSQYDPVNGNLYKLNVSGDKQKLLILFEKIVDRVLIDTTIVKRNQGLIVEYDLLSNHIERIVSCPPLFGNIAYASQSSEVILMGDQTQFPYTYTLNGITYTRTEEKVKDIVLASFNIDSGSFNWHKVIHVTMPNENPVSSLTTIGDNLYASFKFNDTISLDGQVYGSVIPFNTIKRQAMLGIEPSDGSIKWVRCFKGFGVDYSIHTPFNLLFNGVAIDFYAESDVLMDEVPVSKMASRRYNYIRLSPDGALLQSFNYSFVSRTSLWPVSIPVKVNEADSTVIVVEKIENNEPLLVKGQSYTYRNMGIGYSDFLAIWFKSTPTSTPTGVMEWTSTASKFWVYPNPCADQLHVDGLSAEMMANVNVFDITGKLALSHNLYKDQSLNIQNLPQGLYFIRIQQGESIQQTRFVKQ